MRTQQFTSFNFSSCKMYYQSVAHFPILLALSGQELDLLQTGDLVGKGILGAIPAGSAAAGMETSAASAAAAGRLDAPGTLRARGDPGRTPRWSPRLFLSLPPGGPRPQESVWQSWVG